jgi:glycosyltransferase involved in cell wall biosynthesis/GT2 family glycosyltransferase
LAPALMHIVFVSTELDPVIPGGAGTVIAEVGRRLIAAGHSVEVLLIGEEPHEAPAPGLPVRWVAPGVTDSLAPTQHQANARAAAEALAALPTQPDLVEFQDFGGLGHWALMRRVGLELTRTPIMVRMHGPIGMVLDRVGLSPDASRVLRAAEQEAFAMADAVIAPSQSMARLLRDRYAVGAERIRIGEPPVPAVVPYHSAPAEGPEIVSYGRLGEEKGSVDLVQAAVPLLMTHPAAVLRFVGADGWRIDTGESISNHLAGLVPESVRDRVRFEGPIDRRRLGEAVSTAWFAVFPSRFESFCLAAHEVRALGVPIIVPQRPEFRPYFGYATGALVYDTTVAGLSETMQLLVDRPDMRAAMRQSPLPRYGDPLTPYMPLVPRHKRTQSGLATAALRRLEAAGRPLPTPPPRSRQLADRALDALPESIATILESRPENPPAVRRWRHRRAATAWVREWMNETADGRYPEPSSPAVSVVIPCFNQGMFVHDAIRSVFRQSLDSWEIIVVDDGSTDPETKTVLRALTYPRTRLIRQRNQGLSAARNAGIAAARGRFIVPLDADDELAPAFLACTVEALEAAPGAAFAHTWTRLFGNQNLIWVDRPYNPYQLLLSTSVVGCALIRTEALRAVGGYDTERRAGNEDWDLWLRLLESGWGQVEVSRPLFRYRQHGISMSVTTEARFEEARREIARAHPALYDPEALAARKAEWYPWVSVVVAAGDDPGMLAAQTLDDLEVIVVGGPDERLAAVCRTREWPLRPGGNALAAGVAAARGKFLIDWRPVSDAGPELLSELASHLEDDPDAYAAAVESGRHPTLWRRWSLLDPRAGPDRLAKAGTRGAGPAFVETEYRGAFPHPRWSIDPDAFRLSVYQVRPETEGRFPDWLP